MVLGDAFSVSWGTLVFGIEPIGIQTRATAKKKILVNFHKLFLPEPVLVKDVTGQYIGSDTTCQILNRLPATCQYLPRPIRVKVNLPYKPPFNGRVVTMGFRVSFL